MVPYSSSRAWAAVLALVLIAGAVGAWSWLARVATVVRLPGVLVAGQGPVSVPAAASGVVSRVLVTPGSPVLAGQVVADLVGGRRPVPVRALQAGTVMSVSAVPGDQVGRGSPVIMTDPARMPLNAVLFAGVTAGLTLYRGEQVSVAYPGGQRAGTVSTIGLYPADPAEVRQLLGGQVPGAPSTWVRLITVRLSGAQSFPGASLTPVTATVTVARQRPFDVIMHGGHS